MTDAPSFISQEHFYIFDPTLSYLRKEVKNPAQPGKKTKFTHKFISRSKQLDPYHGLFGFEGSKSYKGTMFRLPFRTHASELSGTCYTEATVRELISAIRESSTNMLLFLQHVRTITIQRIDQDHTTPKVVLKISRENMNPSRSLSLPTGTEIRKLSCTSSSDDTNSSQWLVSQKQMKENVQQNYYTASVACPLGSSEYKADASFEGEIFCFLPLSQKTGLPVHVSSNFAVINNRRGIWTSDKATSQTDKEVAWNLTLMQGVIPSAYHALLVALKEMARKGFLSNYTFHELWPKVDKLLQRNPWAYMVTQLYQVIASDQLFYSANRKQWLYIKQSKFLTPGILCQSSEQLSTPECVLKVLRYLNVPVVDLPVSYHNYFSLANGTIDEFIFIRLFFANLDTLVSALTTRSEVIQCMLEVYAAEYDNQTSRSYTLDAYIQNYACIPCAPDGKILSMCTDVVDSTSDFAGLFDSSEGRFPLDQLLNRQLSYSALKDLGMISEAIPYEVLVERARTIRGLYKLDKVKALERVKLILSSCAKVEKGKPKRARAPKQKKARKAKKVELSSIPFLPVLPRPPGYLLTWKGDSCELACGKDLMIEGTDRYRESINPDCAGSQVAIVNERSVDEGGCGYIVKGIIDLLEIRRAPNVQEVIAHLTVVQQVFQSQSATKELISVTDRMCRQIYGFLDDKLKPDSVQYHRRTWALATNELDSFTVRCLQDVSCVWTGEQFVVVKLIARELWNNDGPYLYRLPMSLSSCKNLAKALKIKEQFAFSDVQEALHKMKQDFKDQPVNERCQNILKDIISFLQKLTLSVSETHILMLPDEHYVLHQSNKLAYNDVDWAPRDPKYNYVHEIVPSHLAKKLQVQPARSKILEKFIKSSSQFKSIAFGQREELTLRIQNILHDYPFDITILKELLQNADDAKATKLYFILDKRTHGSQGILSKNWEKLQGPALLVWNDSEFSERDLQGIQKLGMGSKRSDAETVGQYGIGFNVVYHLTDCPSFITGGETMCVLDPHCKYVHEANELFPGRRFDGLKNGFWKCFPDMSSSYLQSGLDNCPPELQGGSLFRFPLRTTKDHLKNSRIIQRNKQGEPTTEAITPTDMFRMLFSWAPKMKEAMLFLNHIKELQFIVIEERSKRLEIKKKFCTQVDDSAREGRRRLYDALSSFTSMQRNRSVIIRYPLTISNVCCHPSGIETSTEEKWLIQQGVGDIDNERQMWSFIDTVKPRHGIAAPIPSPQKPHIAESISTTAETFSKKKFEGNVFCFLPLPVSSKLPVHVNGNFILNSTRRNLWVSTETGREDDRSMWNIRLFQAISSSYADFLVHARSFYVSAEPYKTWATVNNDISQYYGVFPRTADLERQQYKDLAASVYQKLVAKNVEVLAVVSKNVSSATSTQLTGSKTYGASKQTSQVLVVEWHPPKSRNPSTQVYFWGFLRSVTDWKDIKNVLEDLGMKLTAASSFLQDHLNEAIKEQDNKIESTSPEAVFEYYCMRKFCAQASHTGQFPCAINESVFKSVAIFKKFTEYLLNASQNVHSQRANSVSHLASNVKELMFPKVPFGHPLLLTADNQLRRFQEITKVINSSYLHLFPKCLESFLHPDMAKLSYSSTYFVACSSSNNTYALSLIKRLVAQHLPQCLRANRVTQFPPDLSKEKLKKYWECFQHCPVFQSNLPELLEEWALIPSTSRSLHSNNDTLVPVVPLVKQESGQNEQVCKVLQLMGIPFLNTAITQCIPAPCPTIDNPTAILKTLFHLNQEKDLSAILGKRADTIISYLTKIDFRHDKNNLHYVKSLPLFECVDGVLRAVVRKTIFIWPSEASDAGYSDWTKYDPSVLFLKDGVSWTHLGGSDVLGIGTLTAEELYYQYIFNFFSALSESDRNEHLTHIKDVLFKTCIIYKNSTSKHAAKSRQKMAKKFLSQLTSLQCISKDDLKPISHFCNHEVPIFTTFSKHFNFLPNFFKRSWDEWLEFFKELGLKHVVSQNEFEQFCRETADGKHENPAEASRVLLEYLCSESAKEAGWHRNESFLCKIGNIPFVPTKSIPEVTWIRNGRKGSNNPTKWVSFTKLNEAECAIYLWTLKPIVQLPANFLIEEHRHLAEKLGITCKATVTDVIENIRIITASKKFTDFNHFDQYPDSNKPPDTPGTKSLKTVMVQNLKYLESNQSDLTLAHIQLLRDTSCIPVHTTFTGHLFLADCAGGAMLCSESNYHRRLSPVPTQA